MTDYVEYRYSTPNHSHPDIAAALLELVDQRLQTGTICELGCGSGWLSHRLAERGYTVIGVDLSESGIKAAFSEQAKGARFELDRIDIALPERLELSQECDLVVSNDVIEHLYRPADLLEAARGLLKPDGLLVVATPYHGYLKNVAIALAGKSDAHYDPLWEGGHIKFFSRSKLTTLFTRTGFAISEIRYIGRVAGLWKSMIGVATVAHGGCDG